MQVQPTILGQVNAWVRDILALFRQKPGKWMLLGLAHVFFFAMLPGLIGLKFVSFLLLPAFLALAVGFYRDADIGRESDLGDLLNEIKPSFRKLLGLGAICVAYVLLINLLTAEDAMQLEAMARNEENPEQVLEQSFPILVKLMLLLTPLVLVIWFAPALVAYQEYSVGRAIKSSLAAFIQYLLPLLLTWVAVTLIIMLSMTLAGVLVGMMSAASKTMGGFLMLVLVFACMLFASALMLAFQYVSNRDIFKMPRPGRVELL
ncbi:MULTISPECIES: BPSS1780 family membrane protein [Methylobacillus]|uniref:Transmembrane protein n=1 Tax=Methylobacillus flagellatus (strain ATCC 51484 / DSM 6875 / VKM B-1610 / KT) TaxID=265072 RepID=Q1H4F4_METFK|nr:MULTISPECIES: BPSS1780 family membrane protein [Methylobacillus]ABE48633.1 hypothetical protein Mfla_0362 [Methylobacillus flagellatus KT]MPS49290.1 hypothetical protein [Methylobacillus sp.]